jgi:hypothetical protein
VHGLLARAAAAVAAAGQAIRALIILARVICGDETPVRTGPGPKARKKYLHVACTNLLTCYFLGDRDLASFKGFIYSDLHGTVVVHDRYPITQSPGTCACSGTASTPACPPSAACPAPKQAAARPAPAGMPQAPGSRRAAVPRRHR